MPKNPPHNPPDCWGPMRTAYIRSTVPHQLHPIGHVCLACHAFVAAQDYDQQIEAAAGKVN